MSDRLPTEGRPFCCVAEPHEKHGSLCHWHRTELGVHLRTERTNLSREDFLFALEEAVSWWSHIIELDFKILPDANGAQIIIDSGRIDGPSGTLAWSQLPCGSVTQLRQMYDSSERWTIKYPPPSGMINAVTVLAHEIGHAIGIPHIEGGNVMQPNYTARWFGLRRGDVREAHRRYNPRSSTPLEPQTPWPPVAPDPPAPDPPTPDPPQPRPDWETFMKIIETILSIIGCVISNWPGEGDDALAKISAMIRCIAQAVAKPFGLKASGVLDSSFDERRVCHITIEE